MIGVVLVLIVTGLTLFLGIRQRNSYNAIVHKDAVSLLKVHTDGIVADLIWDGLWHRADSGRETQRQGLMSLSTGLEIPANIFLYNFQEEPGVFFGTLSIENKQDFQQFISRHSGWESQAGDTLSRLSSDHFIAAYNTDEIAFALFITPREEASWVASRLVGLLKHEDQVPLQASSFGSQIKSKGHVNLLGKNKARLDFEKGWIRFALNAPLAEVQIPESYKQGNSGFLRLSLSEALQGGRPQWNLGPLTLSRDSLAKYNAGALQLWWKGSTLQKDVVIRYDYDDDFNPIEVADTIERKVPAIYGRWDARAEPIVRYLRTAGLLDTLNSRLNPEAFPMFALYAKPLNANQLYLGSVEGGERQVPEQDKAQENSNLFYLNLDVIAAQEILPKTFNSFLEPLTSLELKADISKEKAWTLQGKVGMRKPSVNSLIQFLE